MFDVLAILTGLIVVAFSAFALLRSRDTMHPALVFAPFLLFVYSIWPLLLNANGDLAVLFGVDPLLYGATIYLFGLLALYLGLTRTIGLRTVRAIRRHAVVGQGLFSLSMDEQVRKRVYVLALAMGATAVAAYLYMIGNVGGFVPAYSRIKGGGWAPSGYIGEAVLLAFPAVLLLALSRQGRRVDWRFMALSIVMVVPHLMQGTFGGRRGPLFLALSVLFLGWFIARGRRPKLPLLLGGFLAIGLAVLVVQSQRQHLYLGSEGEFDAGRIAETVRSLDALESNDYVAGIANMLTTEQTNDFYWGRRLFVSIFVRPIPRQIWPTKYEDMGATWLERWDADAGGFDFLQAVGFRPPSGSSIGLISDMFHEFAWGCLIALYLFGWGIAVLWKRHRLRGGVWTVVYIEALILGIYLPTQSFSAFYHRFLIMAIATAIVWKFWVMRGRKGSTATATAAAPGGDG